MLNTLIRLMGIMIIASLMRIPALAASPHLQDTRFQNTDAQAAKAKYTNPLSIQIPNDGMVESCADPSIIRAQTQGDNNWYMYCTTDPLNDSDRTGNDFNFHFIPMLRSSDLVNWIYEGDAFSTRPSWATGNAGLWAPEIQFLNGKYYIYYTVTDTTIPGGGSAIGVAKSTSTLGPYAHSIDALLTTH